MVCWAQSKKTKDFFSQLDNGQIKFNLFVLSVQPLICPQNGDVKKQNRAPVSYGWRDLTPNSAMDEITKKNDN